MSSQLEIAVIAGTPVNFVDNSPRDKLDRYRRVMKWHDEYLPRMYGKGVIRNSWGTHELLSRFDPTTSLGLHIAIYEVADFYQFDELFNMSPLRDCSRFTTLPLCSLFDDQKTDGERTERARNLFMTGKTNEQKLFIEQQRALYSGSPDFVGKYKLEAPKNSKNNLSESRFPDDSLQILVTACNPNNLIESWDDLRKLVLYEKVDDWFHYMAMMIQDGYVSHAWGTHDFCVVSDTSTNSKGAMAIYRVKDLENFHVVYNLDPLREWSRFHTAVLQPIASQRKLDELRLREAEKRL